MTQQIDVEYLCQVYDDLSDIVGLVEQALDQYKTLTESWPERKYDSVRYELEGARLSLNADMENVAQRVLPLLPGPVKVIRRRR